MTDRPINPSVLGPADKAQARAAVRLARIYRTTNPALSRAFLRDAARYRRECSGHH